jgi:lysophospholipase L1-like esterase
MNLTRLFTAASTAVVLLTSAASAQNGFALKDGDRVVFYGDSITESRQYTNMTETYVLTRFPKLNVRFIGSGWSGDRISGWGVPERLQRDVLAHNPTVVTAMFGMNDGSYQPLNDARFNDYSQGYQKAVDTLKQGAPGVRITAIQPSPYDDVTRTPNIEGGYNTVLLRFGQYLIKKNCILPI